MCMCICIYFAIWQLNLRAFVVSFSPFSLLLLLFIIIIYVPFFAQHLRYGLHDLLCFSLRSSLAALRQNGKWNCRWGWNCTWELELGEMRDWGIRNTGWGNCEWGSVEWGTRGLAMGATRSPQRRLCFASRWHWNCLGFALFFFLVFFWYFLLSIFTQR